jgi:hypothetical protein
MVSFEQLRSDVRVGAADWYCEVEQVLTDWHWPLVELLKVEPLTHEIHTRSDVSVGFANTPVPAAQVCAVMQAVLPTTALNVPGRQTEQLVSVVEVEAETWY